mmetsp:Transcript_42022/g.116017  ORF Transcript_42022/g.116017 Transcript_42022/m.116017 type:complete len:85 (+) Transcript_42022:1138-1392(+)
MCQWQATMGTARLPCFLVRCVLFRIVARSCVGLRCVLSCSACLASFARFALRRFESDCANMRKLPTSCAFLLGLALRALSAVLA